MLGGYKKMKQFISVNDLPSVEKIIKEAITIKNDPYSYAHLGKNKTLGLIFMNPSLRTRMSTQKAAANLGMQVMVLNIDKEAWALEFNDGAIMNGTNVEHIKDAAAVMGMYCDIIGLRSFPGLINKDLDYSEYILNKFISYTKVPVISLESATLHPLQSLADLITIEEHKSTLIKPKVVLTWAPHIKALPQAVANSFSEWMLKANVEFIITHPEGMNLNPKYTEGAKIIYQQEEALQDADFIYIKNWSSFNNYGQVYDQGEQWLLNKDKLRQTRNAKIMHCLPVRRNVEVPDELLDGPNSLILEQANNRIYAAQVVLKNILENIS